MSVRAHSARVCTVLSVPAGFSACIVFAGCVKLRSSRCEGAAAVLVYAEAAAWGMAVVGVFVWVEERWMGDVEKIIVLCFLIA